MNWKKEKELIAKTIKTPIKFKWSALLIPALLIFMVGVFQALIWTPIIFVLILLHEMGHVWAAKRSGTFVFGINFCWNGGLAEMDGLDLTYKWKKNLFISIMGPIVSLLIAMIFFILDSMFSYNLLYMIAWANIGFFVFNMLPVYPMDGGRILYSFVYRKIKSPKKALNLTTKISYVLGIVLSLIAFIFGYFFAGIILLSVLLLAYINKQRMDKILKW